MPPPTLNSEEPEYLQLLALVGYDAVVLRFSDRLRACG